MLDRLKRQGITILVSTPYMDEASRCDRIALVRSGECLSIDTPVGIRTSFDRRLYAVRCASMYKLLGDVAGVPGYKLVFRFWRCSSSYVEEGWGGCHEAITGISERKRLRGRKHRTP